MERCFPRTILLNQNNNDQQALLTRASTVFTQIKKKQFTFYRLFVTEILQTASSLKATINYYFNLICIADSFVPNVRYLIIRLWQLHQHLRDTTTRLNYSFYHPPEILESLCFSDIFRGDEKRTFGRKQLVNIFVTNYFG